MVSANVPSPVIVVTGVPSGRVPRGIIDDAKESSHRWARSRRHCQQLPHAGTKAATTRSPFITVVTWSPTSSTIPVPSWPRMHGGGNGRVPLITERSE